MECFFTLVTGRAFLLFAWLVLRARWPTQLAQQAILLVVEVSLHCSVLHIWVAILSFYVICPSVRQDQKQYMSLSLVDWLVETNVSEEHTASIFSRTSPHGVTTYITYIAVRTWDLNTYPHILLFPLSPFFKTSATDTFLVVSWSSVTCLVTRIQYESCYKNSWQKQAHLRTTVINRSNKGNLPLRGPQ
jgi:hypothetical protein